MCRSAPVFRFSGVLQGFNPCFILILTLNTVDNNINYLKNTMNTLNSCLNEYVKENEDLDNPLSNLMINSPYYDINYLINNLQNKHPDTYQAQVLHLNIHSLSSKFDSLITLLDNLQTNGIYFFMIVINTCLIYQVIILFLRIVLIRLEEVLLSMLKNPFNINSVKT